MRTVLKLEEFLMFAASAYGLYILEADWWFYLLLLIGPDISMLGYLAGNKVGAISYNIFHHKGLAIVIFLIGLIGEIWMAQVLGLVLFGHASMDRVFGYGLKYFEGFKFTHLGQIGAKN